MENAELTVHEEEGDFFKISLSEKETPQAFKRRVEELMLSGLSEGEARHNAATTPEAMELFYDCGRGMFAIESEPLLHIGIFNPYTGFEIPNENLPAFPRPKESSVSADKIPIVPVPVHLLSILLDYMWQEEKKSWEELVFEQNRTKRPSCCHRACFPYNERAVRNPAARHPVLQPVHPPDTAHARRTSVVASSPGDRK